MKPYKKAAVRLALPAGNYQFATQQADDFSQSNLEEHRERIIQNGWVFISELVFATAEFNQIKQWLKCLYYHMKSKKRPTLLEIQNRIILPHLHGIYAQQWIIDQCPNWKEYKDFIYKLSKEKRQT